MAAGVRTPMVRVALGLMEVGIYCLYAVVAIVCDIG